MAVIWWIRRDFCLEDNLALLAAIATGEPVIPLYIFDQKRAPGENSRWWLAKALEELSSEVNLVFRCGDTVEELIRAAEESGASGVYWNRCYDELLLEGKVKEALGVPSKTYNSSLLFEPWALSKTYRVFTPFWKACMGQQAPQKPLPAPKKIIYQALRSEKINFAPKKPLLEKRWVPGRAAAKKILRGFIEKRLKSYVEERDFPALEGNSNLSPYLHFGHLTPRMVWHAAADLEGGDLFLRQLGWREFASHLLFHFPRTPEEPLYEKYKKFPWRDDPAGLKAWKEGKTGYPIVDAGMRELADTGFMHNRVRMIAGSFLVKDLLIPWQEGAKWFWENLVDADLANNTLGWQWVAGCGADAAPFFRIFNPTLQGEKFDPEGEYVKKFVPELKNVDSRHIHRPWEVGAYIPPIVDHKKARERALKALEKIK